jgi:protease I
VLETHGAKVDIISTETDTIKSWKDGNWGSDFDVDVQLKDTNAENYDALVLPGGVINPDLLRRDDQAVNFVRTFFKQSKPVAAICHGPWMLAEANVLDGRNITSFHSIRTDMENAGAKWVDKEVVVDQGLVTSRSPADLEAFNNKIMEEVLEGRHEEQTV